MTSGPVLRLLTFSTLFPNPAQPNHGVFVANRLRHLVGSGEANSVVLAPMPYFPRGRLPAHLAGMVFNRRDMAALAQVPLHEQRDGIDVHHPRYLSLPGMAARITPDMIVQAAAPMLAKLLRDGDVFDAIDAHYLYPDGVAAVALGKRFNLPVVITARGSDVTQWPDFPRPRRRIQHAIAQADALISVSAALGAGLVKLGADPTKVHVLRNGIDLAQFQPQDPTAARAALGITGKLLISVGLLIPRKGHDKTIAALKLLPDVSLIILGEGPERTALLDLAQRLGVADRVRLLGAKPHAELPHYYSAADAMVLASSREGWANVLLESMACGTPVLASNIPGNPEVVQSPEAGLILRENTPEGIAEAWRALQAAPVDRSTTRHYAERFGWDETTQGQLRVFRSVLTSRRMSHGA
jgi:glycosyltransferase involved in cell wall biosynthesis